MNTNEPVAWIPIGMTLAKPKDLTDCIPLYAHPIKELTDEEIKQVFQEQTGFFFDDNPADDLALMDFARALLRKAQEK